MVDALAIEKSLKLILWATYKESAELENAIGPEISRVKVDLFPQESMPYIYP